MSEFESQNELNHKRLDAEDRLRTETQLYLRRYVRRIKEEGVSYVRAQFTINPNSDPDVVAKEALHRASQGMFLLSPQKALEHEASS